MTPAVFAAVLVNPPAPLTQHNMGDTSYGISIGGSSTGAPAGSGFYNSTQGYRFIRTTSALDQDLVWLDVSTNANLAVDSGKKLVVTLSTGTTAGTEIPLVGAGVVTSNTAPPACNSGGFASCQGGTGSNLSANYNKGNILRVSFSVAGLCATQGATGTLCANSAYSTMSSLNGATLSQPVTVTFGTVQDNVSTGPVGGSNTDSVTFTLTVSDIPPSTTCPATLADYFFPGDGSVYLSPGNYSPSAGTNSTYTGLPLKHLTVLASRSGANPFVTDSVPQNEVIAYVDVNGGTQAVAGFVNTTDGNDNKYDAYVYAQNEAGIISATAGNTCHVVAPYQFQAQTINGLLTKSKCFIATAAYQDGDAGPVVMLRRFRDRILSRHELGKRFIENYYRYSPALAEWAWDKPFIRSVALRLLAPIELLAWAILEWSHAEEVSPQPYIDRVKSQMKDEGPVGEGGEGYSAREKKKLGASPGPEEVQPYIDQLKSRLDPVDSAYDYTVREREKLPSEKERLSPIELVRLGKDRNPEPERPPITQALGVTVGVGPGMTVTNTEGALGYSEIYGSKFQPELMLHYERQLFHSENLGSFGLGIDGGIAFADGYGRLSYTFNGTNTSQTKFTFFQFPLMASAYYRFNLLRVLRPYAGGSVGSIFYIENRNDAVKDKRGFSFVYATHLGVSLLLDLFDTDTARDGYASSGIQHSYLFAEFLYLNSFNQTGVILGRSGIYSGFLFEI